MAETLESLSVQVGALATSMDERFKALQTRVEDGFAVVDEHFAEQRAYTEFGYERLEKAIVGRLDAVTGRLDTVSGRFDAVTGRLDTLTGRLDTVTGRFDRLERKLDQCIEAQLRTNQLVERRLPPLEPPDQNAPS